MSARVIGGVIAAAVVLVLIGVLMRGSDTPPEVDGESDGSSPPSEISAKKQGTGGELAPGSDAGGKARASGGERGEAGGETLDELQQKALREDRQRHQRETEQAIDTLVDEMVDAGRLPEAEADAVRTLLFDQQLGIWDLKVEYSAGELSQEAVDRDLRELRGSTRTALADAVGESTAKEVLARLADEGSK